MKRTVTSSILLFALWVCKGNSTNARKKLLRFDYICIIILLLILIVSPKLFGQGNMILSKLENQNIIGGDYMVIALDSNEYCQTCIDACLNDPKCKAYTYVKPGIQNAKAMCWLKSSVSNPVSDVNCISGIKSITDTIPVLTGTLNKKALTGFLSKMPKDISTFFALASVDLLSKQLSSGQTLGNQSTDSKDFNFHYNWATKIDGNTLYQNLTEKFKTMLDLKVKEGVEAKANWYALVCTTWAEYGIDFGSPAANSTDPEVHRKWATGLQTPVLWFQITARLDKIFSNYGIEKPQTQAPAETNEIDSQCDKMLKIPGLVIGMSNFAKDGGNKYIPSDYFNELNINTVIDIQPFLEIFDEYTYNLKFYRIPSNDTDNPNDWILPPGIVIGLTYHDMPRGYSDRVFGHLADSGPYFLGGNKFKKEHGGDLGASSGYGWYWYESTGTDFSDWNMIKYLPKGTVVGLVHSINQKGKQFIWQGYTYDASNADIAPPPGFQRRHYGDMGAPKKEGYSWYEKITDPPGY